MLIGDTFARYEIFDALRGIDYLASLPEVDDKRIGAFGCSGGGTVTALASALDARIAATGVACYITSFDALLPALGPQDGEQSSPRFIASGLDFADLIEAAAPRPYAVISTYSDMFPFAGARASVAEARRFYALLDAGAAGVPAGEAGGGAIATPTGPAWNVDTTNHVALGAPLQFITGPGRHGALRPILAQIVGFFLRTLEPEADPEHPVLPPSLVDHEPESPDPLPGISREALQVTKTGQVSTSYPGSETVFTLNRTRAAQRLRSSRGEISATALRKAIRMATGAEAEAGSAPREPASSLSASGHVQVPSGRFNLEAALAAPSTPGPYPAVLFLVPDSIEADNTISKANKARFEELVAQGNVVLAVTPRPSPPGSDDMKSPLLGQFYLLSLRADLVGRTLVGLRVDDAVHAVDFLAARSDVDARRISAIGSGPMGLVLLHAAVLDARLSHVTVDHVLTSYRSLLAAPLPVGAPEDVVPGVLRSYDIPDLVRVLGTRATVTEPLQGSDDLSQTSTPLATLQDLQH
jgi:dienelactone hydrolase